MTRTFIAIELDGELQDYLRGIIRRLAGQLPRLRWVDPAATHLTLAFLGELDDAQVALARQATLNAAAQGDAFSFWLRGLGTFGSGRQPRVLWIGVDEPSGALRRLHVALHEHLERAGFPIERRPFAPHLTLSRIKAPLDAVELQRLQSLLTTTTQPGLTRGQRAGSFASSSLAQEVGHLSVMKSELSRAGATYTCLQACALGSK